MINCFTFIDEMIIFMCVFCSVKVVWMFLWCWIRLELTGRSKKSNKPYGLSRMNLNMLCMKSQQLFPISFMLESLLQVNYLYIVTTLDRLKDNAKKIYWLKNCWPNIFCDNVVAQLVRNSFQRAIGYEFDSHFSPPTYKIYFLTHF